VYILTLYNGISSGFDDCVILSKHNLSLDISVIRRKCFGLYNFEKQPAVVYAKGGGNRRGLSFIGKPANMNE
jgi:hypothetical protein